MVEIPHHSGKKLVGPIFILMFIYSIFLATPVDSVGTWANKVSVSVYSVGNWATEVSVSISILDPNEGYFSGHGNFSRDRTSSFRNWLSYSSICASSMLCPSVMLNVQFRPFSVARLSSRSGKTRGLEIPTCGIWPNISWYGIWLPIDQFIFV